MRILLSVFACLIAGFVVSQTIDLGDPGFLARLNQPSGSCATSDTTLPHDLALDGFTGTANGGYELTGWTETVGAGGAIDANYDSSALTTGKPVGACNEALRITVDGAATWTYYDIGSAQTYNNDFIYYVYFKTLPDNSGESFMITEINNSTSPGTASRARIQLTYVSAGTASIVCTATTTTAAKNVSENQWYKIKIHLDDTAANSYMELNDEGATNLFTRGTGGLNWQYLHIGATQLVTAGENMDAVFDVMAIDDSDL